MLTTILLEFAAFCFALVALNKSHDRVNFMGLGLLFWVLSQLLPVLL